jgi:hypothetical protein
MKYKLTSIFILAAVLLTSASPAIANTGFNPHFLVSDASMTDTEAMTLDGIQDFLERGGLANLVTEDYTGTKRTAAEIIYNAGQMFEINPQFLLVLLQREQSLVEDDTPTQKQLDWAMGYGICDDCSKDDPRLQKFKGFGNQVHEAAKRIRTSYLTDLAKKGTTISGIGPGTQTLIDTTIVEPANAATSVLYTYTPHIHGNKNFVKIWERWFTKRYPNGSLLKNVENGNVWYIKFNQRRKIESMTALISRFNPNRIIPVQPEVLDAYEVGTDISYPNYSLLRTPNGAVHLLVNDTVRGIRSMEAFRKIGFNPDEIINVEQDALEAYETGQLITVETSNVRGSLIRIVGTEKVYFVKNNKKAPVISKDIQRERFPYQSVKEKPADSLQEFSTTEPVKFPDGTLVTMDNDPDVYVIADGNRHLIPDEDVFNSYGWKWGQIIETGRESVLLHPLGKQIKPQPKLHAPKTGGGANENITLTTVTP